MSKNETLTLKEKLQTLKSHVQNEDQRLSASIKLLEICKGQEIQTLQKMVVKRLDVIEETIRANEQGKKVHGQDFNITSTFQG